MYGSDLKEWNDEIFLLSWTMCEMKPVVFLWNHEKRYGVLKFVAS